MEIEKIALEVFENKESYKNIDFIVIMNMLMEQYNKIKGIPQVNSSKEHQCEKDFCFNVLYEDGLCYDCWYLRVLEEGSDHYESDSEYLGDTALDFY